MTESLESSLTEGNVRDNLVCVSDAKVQPQSVTNKMVYGFIYGAVLSAGFFLAEYTILNTVTNKKLTSGEMMVPLIVMPLCGMVGVTVARAKYSGEEKNYSGDFSS